MNITSNGHAATPPPLITIGELAKFLHLNAYSIYHMISKITAADGKRKVGRNWRFDLATVQERIKSGLFARGLDENGQPEANAKERKE